MLKLHRAISQILGAAVCGGLVVPAYAAGNTAASAIRAEETLSQALRNYGQRYGEQIIFTEETVAGLTTASLQGELTAGADLNRLLAGTGLMAERSLSGAWMIRRMPASNLTTLNNSGVRFTRVAQQTPAAPAAPAVVTPAATVQLEEVVVTGSRVARDGFTAPTPTTVLGPAEIQARAASNITEIINELPAFRPSQTPAAGARGGGTQGNSVLDLRGLNGSGGTATTRTLVLVDGRRFVTSNSRGQVDLNLIPSSLIQRTEVVTGGASAAWGSDAVAGVVNLILKDRLQGIETNVQYGEAEEGDYGELSASVAAGTSFASGRGHIIVGAEYVDNDGIPDGFVSRDWGREGWGTVQTAANRAPGIPSRLVAPDVRISDRMAPGGVIFGIGQGAVAGSASLDNIQFLPGGVSAPFQAGSIVGGNQMVGGASNQGIYFTGGSNLVNPIERYAVLARARFDITDDFGTFLEVSRGETEYRGFSASRRDDASLTINRNNAFLPANIFNQMVALNLQTITVGRIAYDDNYNFYTREADQETNRVAAGFEGKVFGDWDWDVYYQWGENKNYQSDQATLNSNYLAAVNAVRDANGNIVCSPALVGAADPGCQPFNIFGQNSPSDAAANYVRGYSINDQTTSQEVAAANITGTPFSIWAGPVSVAAGLEYRVEESSAVTDAASQANRFDLGNYKPLDGSYHTKEIYGEVVVPLLTDVTLARSLELNAAIRETDYSTSGPVTTWKVGLSYEPVADLRFRATQSQDIRAPNISELFAGGIQGRVTVSNPFTGQGGLQYDQITGGNPNLTPETADTFTVGVMYQPSWLNGFRASLDYYQIEIEDVIGQLAAQDLVNQCFAGNAELCSNIVFGPGNTFVRINNPVVNFNSLETSGFDLELAYSTALDGIGLPGQLTGRAFGTYVEELTTTDPVGPIDRVRQTVPQWAANLSLTYSLDRLSTTASVRYIGTTVADTTLIGPDDPAYNPASSNSISQNTRPRVFYTNLSAQYRIYDSEGTQVQVYGVVNNAFDQNPPPNAGGNPVGASLYDLVGRAYKMGFRVSF
jgi:iron complex outermembrane recepter protein